MTDFNSALYILIGDRIKNFRIQNNLNQEALSTMVGIGRTSVSNIELGRHQAPLHLIYKICGALKTEIHSIIPTISEVREAMHTSGFDLLEELNKVDLNESSKQSIESYIRKI